MQILGKSPLSAQFQFIFYAMLIRDGILQHFQVLFCVVLLESLFFLTICVFGPSGKALVRLVWFPALALLSLQRLWFMKGSPFSSKVVVYEHHLVTLPLTTDER